MTSENREGRVVDAFVSLTDTLLDGFDIVDLFTRLTTTCAELLDVAAAGLLLSDVHGMLHVLAATSEATHDLELIQLQREEGPCLDCFRSGTPVVVPDLSVEIARWPRFVPAARQAGFASVHAVPMRVRARVLGTLGLFGAATGQLSAADLSVAQGLAHVATVAILHDHTVANPASYLPRLQRAQASRAVLEQAKGLLYERLGISMTEAFNLLREHAHHTGQHLTDVAHALVTDAETRPALITALGAAPRNDQPTQPPGP